MTDVRTGLDYHSISGPKTKKRRFASIYVPQTDYHPSEQRLVIIGSLSTYVDQDPVAEGQLIDYAEATSNFSYAHRLFVAVDVLQDGNLEWKEVSMPLGTSNANTILQPTSVSVVEP